MPRELPKKGKTYIVIGIKTDKGYRIEYSGQVDEDTAVKVFGAIPGFQNKDFEKSA